MLPCNVVIVFQKGTRTNTGIWILCLYMGMNAMACVFIVFSQTVQTLQMLL